MKEKDSDKLVEMPRLGTERRAVWAYFSLIFTVFYFLPMYFAAELSSALLLVVIALYVAFITNYIILVRTNSSYRLLAIGSLLVICFTALSINTGALVFFGYCLFVIAYYWSFPKSVIAGISVLASIIAFVLLFTDISWQFAMPSLLSSIGLFGFGYMERRETLHQIRLQRSQEAVQQLSTIAERERIGRDLHDIAGHALSSISLKAQLALKLLDKDKTENAKEELAQLASLSQGLLSEIRKAVSDIKSLSMHEEIQKVEDLLFKKGIVMTKQIDEVVIKNLSSIQESNLSLIMKESLINVIRHSNADRVELSLTQSGQEIRLNIKDNGDKHLSNEFHIGNGIKGMQERASILGGKLLTNLKEEFEICVVIPKQIRVNHA